MQWHWRPAAKTFNYREVERIGRTADEELFIALRPNWEKAGKSRSTTGLLLWRSLREARGYSFDPTVGFASPQNL